MRLPRLRIRTLMILVAVVAVGMGAWQAQQRWMGYRIAVRIWAAEEQRWLTLAAEAEAQIAELPSRARRSVHPENKPVFGITWKEIRAELESQAKQSRRNAAWAKQRKEYYQSLW